MSRTRLALDEQGRLELARLLETVVGDALRIQRESAERMGDADAPASSALAILHFDRPAT